MATLAVTRARRCLPPPTHAQPPPTHSLQPESRSDAAAGSVGVVIGCFMERTAVASSMCTCTTAAGNSLTASVVWRGGARAMERPDVSAPAQEGVFTRAAGTGAQADARLPGAAAGSAGVGGAAGGKQGKGAAGGGGSSGGRCSSCGGWVAVQGSAPPLQPCRQHQVDSSSPPTAVAPSSLLPCLSCICLPPSSPTSPAGCARVCSATLRLAPGLQACSCPALCPSSAAPTAGTPPSKSPWTRAAALWRASRLRTASCMHAPLPHLPRRP